MLDSLSDVLTKPRDVLLHLRDVLIKPKDVRINLRDVPINLRDLRIKPRVDDINPSDEPVDRSDVRADRSTMRTEARARCEGEHALVPDLGRVKGQATKMACVRGQRDRTRRLRLELRALEVESLEP